jgi:Domain of unknown function (DUF5753)
MTREVVVERTDLTTTTMYRIEYAQVRPQRRTLTLLFDLYEVPEGDRDELYDLAARAGEQTWLQSLPSTLPSPYLTYIAFEGEATSIANYECMYVPGLLQTEDYARASMRGDVPAATDEEIEQLVKVRMARQDALTRDDPLQLWAIIDEGALRRPVGGPAVMAAQLDRLAEVASLPQLVIQVLPTKVGGHPGMSGAFAVLRFGEPSGVDVVYIESQASGLFLENDTDVRSFTRNFEYLRGLAMPPAESASLITEVARTMAA